MSIKCTNCGTTLVDNDIVIWRCPECNKGFKGNLLYLQNFQKKKDNNPGKCLLKCNNCSKWLDNGKEEISVRCSSCGNMVKGNLKYFTESKEENINNISTINTKKKKKHIVKEKKHIKKREKIAIALFVIIILPSFYFFFKQIYADYKFEQTRESYENIVKKLSVDDIGNSEFISSLSIDTDFMLEENIQQYYVQNDIVNIIIGLSGDFEKLKLADKCIVLHEIDNKINKKLETVKNDTGYKKLLEDDIDYKESNIITNENLDIEHNSTFYKYKFSYGYNSLQMEGLTESDTENKNYNVVWDGDALVSIEEKKEDDIKDTYAGDSNPGDDEDDYNNLTYFDVTNDYELGEVWGMAQAFVKDQLKSPASAKFPVYGDDKVSIKKSGKYYKIAGYVDAENSFGAELRSLFLLVLEKNGDKYKQKECTIFD